MAAHLRIKTLIRVTSDGIEERIAFREGVNVLVGPPNTGKSKWLGMLDYLFGDPGSPEAAFGEDLMEKYQAIIGIFAIDEQEMRIERRWRNYGEKTKTIVDGVALDPDEFSRLLLAYLGIPNLRFPLGNPLSDRLWPTLSWRNLLRHIYRQENYWSDIADKQPEAAQHACMLQFFGLAEKIYPPELELLADLRKKLYALRISRDQFHQNFSYIAKEAIGAGELPINVSREFIGKAIRAVDLRVAHLEETRSEAVDTARNAISVSTRISQEPVNEAIARLATLKARSNACIDEITQLTSRLEELSLYQTSTTEEYSRVQRAATSGNILSTLKITHCPACDQVVDSRSVDDDHCFLCRRPVDNWTVTHEHGLARINLEKERLKTELEESDELIAALSKELNAQQGYKKSLDSEMAKLEDELKPTRNALSTLISPTVMYVDRQLGVLSEKRAQFLKFDQILGTIDSINIEILSLEQKVQEIETLVDSMAASVDYDAAEESMSTKMNEYLIELRRDDPNRWQEGEVRFVIAEKRFRFSVGNGNWTSKLGATLRFYFLMAYHYALLSISQYEFAHYPGLTILDFPLTLADGAVVADQENYIVNPFVSLVSRDGMQNAQVIIAGRAFEKLDGAHRIELTNVWK